MWNLFSTVEPKVIQPARSLKEQLLDQEGKALSLIQQQVNKILASINSLLKPDSSQFSDTQKSQTSLITELQHIVCSLENHIQADNLKFSDYITYRDQQKINQQEFFKYTLRSYENKKSQLNKYIEELENKVQSLELKGFKTYELSPKPSNVLNGINQNSLQKYMNKLEQLKKIQQGLQSFALKNRNKLLKGKSPQSSTEFSHQKQNKQNKTSLIQFHTKCNSLNDLEKELEMILLKEELLGSSLDNKITKCKKNFQTLAHKQNSFKQSIKKMGIVGEQRRKSSNKILTSSKGFSQLHETTNPGMKKTSSFFVVKPETKLQTSFAPSIQNQQQQEEQKEASELSEEINLQDNEDTQETPSQNFIEACEFLITERFIDDKEKKQQNEDLFEPQD